MFLNLAYDIVANTWPPDVYQADAETCVNLTLTLIFATALLGFLLYRFLLWRLWRVDTAQAVNTLRGPWWLGLAIAGGVQFLLGTILGLVMIPGLTFDIVMAVIITAFVESVIAIIVYWILTLISSPQRCWLAPPLRGAILKLLGIIR